ncbi:MAG: hypothetical protein U0791_21795 [Gemmataceae bacterium]
MNSLIHQLNAWRLRERLVRIAWGGSRWFAIVALVLGVACLVDWIWDRRAEVPLAFRTLMTLGQVALAAGLGYFFLWRPWAGTPPIDDLAFKAEKAIPEFDHRLVTALQLNRPNAKTSGMSKALIAEVTREAGEMASKHQLTKLIDYTPTLWAAGLALPVLMLWGGFVAANSSLAVTLVKRQLLLGGEIPRSVQLENITPEVWPSGAEVEIRFRVTGEWTETMTGRTSVVPEGQPADDYPLAFEKQNPDNTATFLSKLPPSSTAFTFTARLADGRTRGEPGRVTFEPPPQVKDVDAWQILPEYLGGRAVELNGKKGLVRYERIQPRGEVVNALPLSDIRVEAKFNKPVKHAFLIPIDRGDGNKETDRTRIPADELAADGLSAEWNFPTTAKSIGYRIELEDQRGFKSPSPARRGIRMLPDEPPAVQFMKESNRNPDPNEFDGKGDPRIYEWDFPVAFRPGVPGEGDTGPIQIIYSARSELGVGRVNIAYRVIPKGEQAENVHPRDDLAGKHYNRLPLSKTAADVSKVGKWVPDLGLFEKSFAGIGRSDPRRRTTQVEFYPVPSVDPDSLPGELEAGGRYNFQTGGLRKKGIDGTESKLEVGDTIELYMEVFDKYATHLEAKKTGGPLRPAGYTREAKRKIIMNEEDAYLLIKQRDEAQRKLQDKLRDIADDQRDVFNPKKKP